MNALAKNDLQEAYEFTNSFRQACDSGAVSREAEYSLLGSTISAVEKLCHVCQALSEENEELRQRLDQCFNVNAAATDAIRDRLSNVSAELTLHTNTQDAHNI